MNHFNKILLLIGCIQLGTYNNIQGASEDRTSQDNLAKKLTTQSIIKALEQRELILVAEKKEQRRIEKQQAATTLLFEGLNRTNINIIRYAIKENANINATDKLKRTPLIWTAIKDFPDATRALLENGAQATINTPDTLSKTPLDYACHENNYEIIRILLEYHAIIPQNLEDNPLIQRAQEDLLRAPNLEDYYQTGEASPIDDLYTNSPNKPNTRIDDQILRRSPRK
jgi:ankyrin repeat protein